MFGCWTSSSHQAESNDDDVQIDQPVTTGIPRPRLSCMPSPRQVGPALGVSNLIWCILGVVHPPSHEGPAKPQQSAISQATLTSHLVFASDSRSSEHTPASTQPSSGSSACTSPQAALHVPHHLLVQHHLRVCTIPPACVRLTTGRVCRGQPAPSHQAGAQHAPAPGHHAAAAAQAPGHCRPPLAAPASGPDADS